jgi:hypothetical protein
MTPLGDAGISHKPLVKGESRRERFRRSVVGTSNVKDSDSRACATIGAAARGHWDRTLPNLALHGVLFATGAIDHHDGIERSKPPRDACSSPKLTEAWIEGWDSAAAEAANTPGSGSYRGFGLSAFRVGHTHR